MMATAIAKPRVSARPKAHHHSVKLMGCHFVLTAVDPDPDKAWNALRAGVVEIERIEELISSWTLTSQTAEINRYAGICPVSVNKELRDLIFRCQMVSELTSGAFDISGTLSRYYWTFDGGAHPMLPQEKIEELRDLMDFRKIELDEEACTVFLKSQGMKIGFGGIGKGYAAHRASEVMKEHGINSGLINASGDLMCWGSPPNRVLWPINIPDPNARGETLFKINIPYGSVVTSGNYEKYTVINGKRLSHIVDPRTGLPVASLKSVSVVCPNPELGDALATAVTVMGPEDGISLINKLNGIECLVIDQFDNKHYSNNLRKMIK